MVDKLFYLAQKLQIDDKSIVYQATSLYDRFYNQKFIGIKS